MGQKVMLHAASWQACVTPTALQALFVHAGRLDVILPAAFLYWLTEGIRAKSGALFHPHCLSWS